jgi:hypothetical protein
MSRWDDDYAERTWDEYHHWLATSPASVVDARFADARPAPVRRERVASTAPRRLSHDERIEQAEWEAEYGG